MLEIERKFLVKELPDLTGCKNSMITQSYSNKRDDFYEIRLRNYDDKKYYLDFKGRGTLIREENGIKITKVKEEKEEEGGPTNPVGRPRGQKTIKKPNIVYGHPKGQKNKKHVMHKEGVHYGRPKKTHINIDGTTKQKQTDKTNSEGVAQESVEKL